MRTTRLGEAAGQNSPTSSDAPSRTERAGRRVRTLRAAGLGSVAALLLGGCQWTAPVQTDYGYEPADGTSMTMGGLELLNVLVVSEGDGAPGTVSALAVNHTDQPIQVGFTAGADQQNPQPEPPQQYEVPAGGSLRLGVGEGAQNVTLAQVPAKAGANMPVAIVSSLGQDAVTAPVMPPEGYYSSLAPTAPATATPQSTGTEQPGPGAQTGNGSPQGTPAPGPAQPTDAPQDPEATPSTPEATPQDPEATPQDPEATGMN